MKNRKHSTTPWEIKLNNNPQDAHGAHGIKLKGNSVSDIDIWYGLTGQGINKDEALANTYLISAAPELLDLAFQFRELVNTMGNGNSPIAKQIELTIDKALGNSEQDV